MPVYNAIGLMSGSSLDGLDLAFVRLAEDAGQWRYEWLATDCVPYPAEWTNALKGASALFVPDFLKLHTAYGHYTGKVVAAFLDKNGGTEKVDFIASHGHTVFHDPKSRTTSQIGDGAAVAAATGLPVITDLRSIDVALGGQGAPIVPIGDRLLFDEYDFLLNLGGIANVTVQARPVAFDICPCNQLLDYYAQKAGLPYDAGGALAESGKPDTAILTQLQAAAFYRQPPPKSLSNDFSVKEILPLTEAAQLSGKDALATCTAHIAAQISSACANYGGNSKVARLLVTGGGAFNRFLVRQLGIALQPLGIEVVVPDAQLVMYKEALVMALVGALRWRGEVNALATVTGAIRDSVGGAIWFG